MRTSRKALWVCRILVPLGWVLIPFVWIIGFACLLLQALPWCLFHACAFIEHKHGELRDAWPVLNRMETDIRKSQQSTKGAPNETR